MKFSMTLVFLALFILVAGVYVYFLPDPEAPLPEEIQEVSMKVLPLEKDDSIIGIRIKNPEKGEVLSLKQENGNWVIVEPVRYPADPMLAQGFVAALSLSQKARRLVPEKGWEEYGLDRPSLIIGINTKLAPKPRLLLFGSKSPIGNFLYARWQDEQEYFLVDANLKEAFNRSLYSTRMKHIFRTPFAEVSKIVIETGREDFEISRQGKDWMWMEPIPLLGEFVPGERVEEILRELAGLHIKEFEDQLKDTPVKKGISEASPSIQVAADEKEKTEVLYLGQEFPSRDSFYAKRKGEEVLFLVAKNNVSRIFQTVETMAQEAMKARG